MIVLFTDFGVAGPYVGQMQAVLARQAPGVPVITLFSDAPTHDPRAAAYLLAAYIEEFPSGAVFLCVVDPGVGGSRQAGFLKAADRWFVGPDNGLFEVVIRRGGEVSPWHQLTEMPAEASATFHGRDIFAPVAASLALGIRPPFVEHPIDAVRRTDWPDDLAEIVYIDAFGNGMTGVRAERAAADAVVEVNGTQLRRARTFSDVAAGTPFWYRNANGLLEIAVNLGRAADLLALKPGTPVKISGL